MLYESSVHNRLVILNYKGWYVMNRESLGLKFNGETSFKLEVIEDKPYRVYAVNMSQFHVTKFRIVGKNEEVVLQEPLKNTCDLASCEACYDANKYEIFAVFQRDDPSVEIQLYLKHPTNGKEGWGDKNWMITPGSGDEGEVHCIGAVSLT